MKRDLTTIQSFTRTIFVVYEPLESLDLLEPLTPLRGHEASYVVLIHAGLAPVRGNNE